MKTFKSKRRHWGRAGLLCLLVLTTAGCAHGISATLRQQADATLSFAQLHKHPEAYVDRVVILGGEIVQTSNRASETQLEVLQKPLGRFEQPCLTDDSDGRFMARCDAYLDPSVYTQGREVTVAGRVLGSTSGAIGEVTYAYPVISCLEVHLWPERQYDDVYARWYGDPWYWRPYPYRYWRHSYW